jgi:hypothetical protein
MTAEGLAYLRESLLSLPFPYALLAVFVTACAAGTFCILVRVGLRIVPAAIKELRSRSARKALID